MLSYLIACNNDTVPKLTTFNYIPYIFDTLCLSSYVTKQHILSMIPPILSYSLNPQYSNIQSMQNR